MIILLKNSAQIFLSLLVGLLLLSSCNEQMVRENDLKPLIRIKQDGQLVENKIHVFSFPTKIVGTESKVEYSIENKGEGPLRIGRIGVDNDQFYIVQPEVDILNPKEKTTFWLVFAPTRGGDHVANIGFFTSDPEAKTFDFLVTGKSTSAALITYIDTDTPEGLNTVSFADGPQLGTRFLSHFTFEDPYRVINSQTVLHLKVVFSDGTKAEVIKSASENSINALKILSNSFTYGISVRFGMSMYLDCKAYLEFENGDFSNEENFRINRPPGAN